jgi:hypothetical protein
LRVWRRLELDSGGLSPDHSFACCVKRKSTTARTMDMDFRLLSGAGYGSRRRRTADALGEEGES